MCKHRIAVCLLFGITLIPAQAASRKERALEAEYERLRQVSGNVLIVETLPGHSLHTEEDGFADLSKESSQLQDTCVKSYSSEFIAGSEKIVAAVRSGAPRGDKLRDLFDLLQRLQREADRCSLPLKVRFYFGTVLRDNSQLPLIDWLYEMERVSVAWDTEIAKSAARKQRWENFWAALASGLANMQPVDESRLILVRPYIRADGTLVDSHLRTTPNSTCLDNLNGCK